METRHHEVGAEDHTAAVAITRTPELNVRPTKLGR